MIKTKTIDAITIGTMGALAIWVSNTFGLPAWVLFIGWVAYYSFGKAPLKAVNSFLLILAGIVLAMLVQYTGVWLTGYFQNLGFPVAVFFLVGFLGVIKSVKGINNLLAYFLGMIAFFGAHLSAGVSALFQLGIPLALGFMFAWSLDTIQSHLHNTREV
jgi:hypothetical protein